MTVFPRRPATRRSDTSTHSERATAIVIFRFRPRANVRFWPKAEIYGVEVELRAGLWPGGSASFDLGHTHYKTSSYLAFDPDALEDGIVQLITFAGGATDRVTINASLRHDFNLPNGASLTPMLGVYWESFEPTLGPTDVPGLAFEFCKRVNDYAKWRARLTYEPPNRGYQVSLFGNNITDELIYTRCGRGRGAYEYTYERPASWGVEFSARWGAGAS